jgi:pimeloyl-ACP methyl ester carboxylesterase
MLKESSTQSPSSSAVQCHTTRAGHKLAYQHQPGDTPGVIFLCGFHSDMGGTKAEHLANYCAEKGLAFTRFDYFGHGASDGKAEDGTIGGWLDDALEIFDTVAKGPQIVVGSSMGGWLALLLSLKRAKRVVGLVGIAAAPDFTEALMWDRMTDKQQKQMMRQGWLDIPNEYGDPYRVTVKFLEESTNHFLLDKPTIDIRCPVTLLHGINDVDVPFEFSMAINEKLASKQVRTMLIPDGDHRLSSERHLRAISNAIEKMLPLIAENGATTA